MFSENVQRSVFKTWLPAGQCHINCSYLLVSWCFHPQMWISIYLTEYKWVYSGVITWKRPANSGEECDFVNTSFPGSQDVPSHLCTWAVVPPAWSAQLLLSATGLLWVDRSHWSCYSRFLWCMWSAGFLFCVRDLAFSFISSVSFEVLWWQKLYFAYLYHLPQSPYNICSPFLVPSASYTVCAFLVIFYSPGVRFWAEKKIGIGWYY